MFALRYLRANGLRGAWFLRKRLAAALHDLIRHALAVAGDLEETPRTVDRCLARRKLEHREAAEQFLRLGIRPVDHAGLAVGPPQYRAMVLDREEAAARQEFTVLEGFLDELVHLFLVLSGRPAGVVRGG